MGTSCNYIGTIGLFRRLRMASVFFSISRCKIFTLATSLKIDVRTIFTNLLVVASSIWTKMNCVQQFSKDILIKWSNITSSINLYFNDQMRICEFFVVPWPQYIIKWIFSYCRQSVRAIKLSETNSFHIHLSFGRWNGHWSGSFWVDCSCIRYFTSNRMWMPLR